MGDATDATGGVAERTPNLWHIDRPHGDHRHHRHPQVAAHGVTCLFCLDMWGPLRLSSD
jgi:hypothetical protein